ncbi:MAG: NF038129 family PEP-CTERM protein [Massilia sp.]
MHHYKNIFARLALALALCASAGGAGATAVPYFHVDIDTSTLGSGSAYLGFNFLVLSDTGSSASLSGLTGALVGAENTSGSVSGALPGTVVFSSPGGGGDLVQAITLGGHFIFDVSFVAGSGDGSAFSWALFNDTSYLGANGDLGSIFVQPGAPIGQQLSFVTNALTQVNQVPEPAPFLLMLVAGCAMFAALRRRQG